MEPQIEPQTLAIIYIVGVLVAGIITAKLFQDVDPLDAGMAIFFFSTCWPVFAAIATIAASLYSVGWLAQIPVRRRREKIKKISPEVSEDTKSWLG